MDIIRKIEELEKTNDLWNILDQTTQRNVTNARLALNDSLDSSGVSAGNIIFIQNEVTVYPPILEEGGIVSNIAKYSFSIEDEIGNVMPGSKVLYIVHHTSRFETTNIDYNKLIPLVRKVGQENVLIIAMTRGSASFSNDATASFSRDGFKFNVVTLRYQNGKWLKMTPRDDKTREDKIKEFLEN